jgi:replication fork protection complex subunit Tof1/Swi1
MESFDSFELDESLRDSVTGLVSALGGIDFTDLSHPYVLGDDALGCLKDLKKWIKFYGSSGKLDALRCIAETNLVSLDICQILGRFKEGEENDKMKYRLVLNCCAPLLYPARLTSVVEILVQLTWQIELAPPYQEDTIQCSYEASLKAAHLAYKNAILHHSEHNILRPIIRIALPSMAIPRRDRPERDEHIISLLISLLRNLLEISGRNSQGDMDYNTQYSRSEAILSFEKSDVFSLLAALAAGATDEYEKVDCLLLEVLYHLLKGVGADHVLATAIEVRTVILYSDNLTVRELWAT